MRTIARVCPHCSNKLDVRIISPAGVQDEVIQRAEPLATCPRCDAPSAPRREDRQ